MKVTSALANMEIGIGDIRRQGNRLILRSDGKSSVDTEISVSAAEVLRTLGRILTTPSSLVFVLGLPYFWWRDRRNAATPDDSAAPEARRADINKPW